MRGNRLLTLTLSLCGLLFSTASTAFTTAQHEAIIRLGDLNGVAVQCGYPAEIHRLKLALVEAVPKVSQLGDMYEDATRQRFLAMTQNHSPCPGLAAFSQEVDQAIVRLHETFASSPPPRE